MFRECQGLFLVSALSVSTGNFTEPCKVTSADAEIVRILLFKSDREKY